MDNLEDELDKDNHSRDDPVENDENVEALIKAFSPPNDQGLDEEIQQVTQSECLSPRGFQHDKFNFKNKDNNTFIAGTPNTRPFYSRSSK